MKWVGFACLLAACAASPSHGVVTMVVPPDLQSCAPALPGIEPPSVPRTFDAVVDWAQRTEQRRADTARALGVCRERLEELNVWVKRRQ